MHCHVRYTSDGREALSPYKYGDFGIPPNVDAAVRTKDSSGLMATHFFKDQIVYASYPDNSVISYSLTSSVSTNIFINAPQQFEAAADQIYPIVVFFKGSMYYRYNVQTKVVEDSGSIQLP